MCWSSKMELWLSGRKRQAVHEEGESENQTESFKSKKRTRRKDSSENLSLGFTSAGSEDNPKPVCVLRSEMPANEALNPCKLNMDNIYPSRRNFLKIS